MVGWKKVQLTTILSLLRFQEIGTTPLKNALSFFKIMRHI